MKFALAQFNPKIGDFSGNRQRLFRTVETAKAKQVDLLVFPELTLTGYPPRDLLDYPEFIAKNLALLEALATQSHGLGIVCGFVERNPSPEGKPFFNSAAFLYEGRIQSIYRKQLLPFYDVFEEERYFEAGKTPGLVTFKGKKIALSICEDGWNASGQLPRPYALEPLAALKGQGADVLVNISASPFQLGKPRQRLAVFATAAKIVQAPVLFCNQVGANDELIFDGASFALNAQGEPVAAAKVFEEDFLCVELAALQNGPVLSPAWPTVDEAWIEKALVLGVKDYVTKCGMSRVCLGLSGGIDSSVTAVLAQKALGTEAVKGFLLPSSFTAYVSNEDAQRLAQRLGIDARTLPIEPMFKAFKDVLGQSYGAEMDSLTLENLQPRIRMTLLMAAANHEQLFLLNTSNKSELATGFSTLYGDSAGALAVLGDLTKRQVFALARWLNSPNEVIPARVLQRPPTAELRAGQTDEDTLPPYALLDPWVEQTVERTERPGGADGLSPPLETFVRMHRASEYKRRQFPPILKISARAFGMGRRVPIAASREDL